MIDIGWALPDDLAAYVETLALHPSSVSPVLAVFLRSWNDSLDDETRQKLKPYAARAIGTAYDGRDEERGWLCVDWLARTQLPAWLELAGLVEQAAAVRALPAIGSSDAARAGRPTLDAAWAAAWDEAATAVWDGVWIAAWDAVWAPAWSPARAAARAAAGTAAGTAAWAAAGTAAWAAAGAAAWAAAWDGAALNPTVAEMQISAFGLLEKML